MNFNNNEIIDDLGFITTLYREIRRYIIQLLEQEVLINVNGIFLINGDISKNKARNAYYFVKKDIGITTFKRFKNICKRYESEFMIEYNNILSLRQFDYTLNDIMMKLMYLIKRGEDDDNN
jgi:hypothetical protein